MSRLSPATYNGFVARLLLLLLLLPSLALAQDVDRVQADTLVQALKRRPLDRTDHDILVELGEQSAAADAEPEARLWVGWALVRADRPDLGWPLVSRGLAESELDHDVVVRAAMLAEREGQDGLVRRIFELARAVDRTRAEQLERTLPAPSDVAVVRKGLGRRLGALELSATPAEAAGRPTRVLWWLRNPHAARTVVLLPDGGSLGGLPRACQDRRAARSALAVARTGAHVVLPGLRGCDSSDGLTRGWDDLREDIEFAVEMARDAGLPVVVAGRGVAGRWAAQASVDGNADRYVAVDPADLALWIHLPDAVLDAHPVPADAATLVVVGDTSELRSSGELGADLAELPRALRRR